MKIKITLSIMIMIGVALAIIFQGAERKVINRASAQLGGGCNTYSSSTEQCSGTECGIGLYEITAFTVTGPGYDGSELRSVPCQGSSCGNVPGVSTRYPNGYCCDQDFDLYDRTGSPCGGNDCNDDPNNGGGLINPGRREICDGIDNNCRNGIDEGCPTPTPTPSGGGPIDPANPCADGGCSPIVIDLLGNGFDLTNANNGVNFDFNNDNVADRLSWIAANSDDAWLVLDRNGNGTIDSGRELFGNLTPQPEPAAGEERHGFRALAKYDKPQQGGNDDGWIDASDSIFSSLRLWQDTNHNGISEQSELHTLTSKGLTRLDLDYHQSNRVDGHGNQFKYRAKVRDAQGAQLGRWAWDVFLLTRQP